MELVDVRRVPFVIGDQIVGVRPVLLTAAAQEPNVRKIARSRRGHRGTCRARRGLGARRRWRGGWDRGGGGGERGGRGGRRRLGRGRGQGGCSRGRGARRGGRAAPCRSGADVWAATLRSDPWSGKGR